MNGSQGMRSAIEANGQSRSGPTFTESIDRHDWSQLGSERYVRDYVNPLKPVIITGALEHWSARKKWTLDFFEQQYGHLPLKIDGRHLSMAELIAEIKVSSPDAPAPYLRNHLISQLPLELQADIAPMPNCTRPNWLEHPLVSKRASLTFIELYIGGKGAKFPFLHYDGLHTHAFLMQLQGVKEYIGFAPDQTQFMYRKKGSGQPNSSEVDDVENWDHTRFELFGQAKGVRFNLHPGETLFMPAGWWHTARILSPSITVSINGVNAPNWVDFRKDFCRYHMAPRKLKAALASAYLQGVGAWLQITTRS